MIVQPSALRFGGQPGYMTYITADYFIVGYISCQPEIHYCVYCQICLVLIITTISFIIYVIIFIAFTRILHFMRRLQFEYFAGANLKQRTTFLTY